jgi:hypothetical protein
MAEYKIEATIEKLEQNSIQLKGVGKYLFEKSKDDVKEEQRDTKKKYLNILEELPITYTSSLKAEKCPLSVTFQDNSLHSHLLGCAFVEKKKLKFKLDEKEKDKYTITAISHADT